MKLPKLYIQKNKQSHYIISATILQVVYLAVMIFQYAQLNITLNQLFVSLTVAVLSSIVIYLEISHYDHWSRQKTIATSFLGVGSILLLFIIQSLGPAIDSLFYLTPIAAYAILVKYLVSERYAIISSVIMAILGGIVFNISGNEIFHVFLFLLLSQWFAIYFYQSIKDRGTLFKTSTSLMTVHFILVIAFELTDITSFTTSQLLIALIFSALSVFLASILTLGLLPLFEAGFNMLTESKLLSLSNPNHPLLRKLLVEAPGTYHHSVMVANLSESACEAIGANGLLARVASYYHDVGKALEPHMFIENQHGKNPHDTMQPDESAQVILRHPFSGANLLREYALPQEIIDVAEQHHGTTLLKFFYYKAKEKDPNVKESSFRYKGPIPQSKEAAIINICDSVEAAVRSKEKPTKEEIHKIVRSIIYDRLMDGQLNASELTLNDLLVIEQDICDMLNGIFHARIEYPNEVKSHGELRRQMS
ncbi:HD family phosphohydrolase [Bacillaceae bacterium W0354]